MECQECVRLWQEYADAISRHADLVNQQEIRRNSSNNTKLRELEAEVLAAAVRLIGARHQAHSHAEINHFRSPDPASLPPKQFNA